MLCATPVLSSDAGCSKKIIQGCGFIMNKNDNDTVFKNLDKIINVFKNNKKKWNSLRKNSQIKIKQNYSMDRMAKTYFKKWNIK